MPDINFSVNDVLDAKIKARWGTTLAWKQWVKDKTRLEITDADKRQIKTDSESAMRAALTAAEAANAAL